MKIGAAVLAGGKSRRMGRNKAMLKIGEVTAVEKILEELKELFLPTIIKHRIKKSAFAEIFLKTADLWEEFIQYLKIVNPKRYLLLPAICR